MSESILLLHLTYYIKFIFLIFIFEVSGFIAIRYLRKKKILSDHTRSGSIICGFLIFLFFYTLLKVDTISLNFGIFGIICIYAFLIRSEKEVDCNSNSSLNNLLIPKLLFSFICFELAALYFIKGGSFPYITPNQDYGYWKATASFIQQYGIENTFHYFSNINPELSGVMVYHYIELWCAALLSDLSEYVNTLNDLDIIKKDSIPHTPEEQLKIVLPLQDSSYIYPLKTPLHSVMKRYYWECHPILPH